MVRRKEVNMCNRVDANRDPNDLSRVYIVLMQGCGHVEERRMLPSTIPFSYNGLNAPNRVWTLYQEDKEGIPPKLPIEPRHLVNAFMEDNVHDYLFRQGEFRYYSRVVDLKKGGVWLLFEYRKHPHPRPQY